MQPTKAPKLTFPGKKSVKSSPEKGPKVAKAPPSVKPIENRAVVVEIEVREMTDDQEPVQAYARFSLRTLKARLGYFSGKHADHPETTAAPVTDGAGFVEILPWTVDLAATKCAMRWIRREDNPDVPPITTKQMLTSQNRDGNNLTCVCARDPSTTPVNDLHPAQLFRVAELLQLIGPSADQFTLKKCMKTYCTSDNTADYNQQVSQCLNLCWNRGDQTWLNLQLNAESAEMYGCE